MEKLYAILKEIQPGIDYDKEEKLIDDGLFDSFDIITVVSELNDAFDININVADILPENLNSARAMKELIEECKKR